MKNLKKLSAITLAFAMLASSSAFAAELTDVNLQINWWIIAPFAPDAITLATSTISNVVTYSTWSSAQYSGSTRSAGEALYNGWLYFGIKDLAWSSSGIDLSLRSSNLTEWLKTITSEKVTISMSDSTANWTWWDIWYQVRWLTKMDGLPWNIIPTEIVAVAHNHLAGPSADSLDTDVTLIQSTARSEWFTWRYWVQPEIKVLIPAYQAIGSYTGLLTLTLTQ